MVSSNASANFPLGVTAVTWIAADSAGNLDSCVQLITVIDTEAPVLTCSLTDTLVMDSGLATSSAVLIPPAVTDNDGVESLTNNAPNPFPAGLTEVVWTATDSSGNQATCSQQIFVRDEEAPVINCSSPIILPMEDAHCYASGPLPMPSVTENFGIASLTHVDVLPLQGGTHDVLWIASDLGGNIDSCIQQVIITDQTAPILNCPLDYQVKTDFGTCVSGEALIAADCAR